MTRPVDPGYGILQKLLQLKRENRKSRQLGQVILASATAMVEANARKLTITTVVVVVVVVMVIVVVMEVAVMVMAIGIPRKVLIKAP